MYIRSKVLYTRSILNIHRHKKHIKKKDTDLQMEP